MNVAIGILATALLSVVGWVLLDRLRWEAWKRQIEINTKAIENLWERMKTIPIDPLPRQEHNDLQASMKDKYADLQALMKEQHAETMRALNAVTERVDRIFNGRDA